MGFFLDRQSKQKDLLFKAKHSKLSFNDKVKIVRNLDCCYMIELYNAWFRDSGGLIAIVESKKYGFEIERSIMLRTDVPVDVSKEIISNFRYHNQKEVVLTRFFSETKEDLFEDLKSCLYHQHIQFPRDKDKEVVKCCLDKYVDQFIKEHSRYVNDICRAIETESSFISIKMTESILSSRFGERSIYNGYVDIRTPGDVSDKRKEMFRQRFGEYIKEYAFKEISYHELTEKIERYLT